MKSSSFVLCLLLAAGRTGFAPVVHGAIPVVTIEDFRAQPEWASAVEDGAAVLGSAGVDAAEIFLDVALSDDRATRLWAQALTAAQPLAAFEPAPADDPTDEGLKRLLREPYARLLSCLAKTPDGLVLLSPDLVRQAAGTGPLPAGSLRGEAVRCRGYVNLSTSVSTPREGSVLWRRGKRWQGNITLSFAGRDCADYPGPGFPISEAIHPELRFLLPAYSLRPAEIGPPSDNLDQRLNASHEATQPLSESAAMLFHVTRTVVRWERGGRTQWELSDSIESDRLGIFRSSVTNRDPAGLSGERAGEVLAALTVPADGWPQVALSPLVYRHLLEVLAGRRSGDAFPTNTALAGVPLPWNTDPVDAERARRDILERCRAVGVRLPFRLEGRFLCEALARQPHTREWWGELARLAVTRPELRSAGLADLLATATTGPRVLGEKIALWKNRNLNGAEADFAEGRADLLAAFARALGMSADGSFPDDPPLLRARAARLRAEPAFADCQSLIGKALMLSTVRSVFTN